VSQLMQVFFKFLHWHLRMMLIITSVYEMAALTLTQCFSVLQGRETQTSSLWVSYSHPYWWPWPVLIQGVISVVFTWLS
jgi:hypothetical protein